MRPNSKTLSSSSLLAILLGMHGSAVLQQAVANAAAATTSDMASTTACDDELSSPVVFPCPNPVRLKMSYVSRGSVECGGALTLDQARVSPLIKADPTVVESTGLYTLVLVDTTAPGTSSETFFSLGSVYPVLHYGAVNIPGTSLLEGLSLDESDDLDVFAPYRGPTAPQSSALVGRVREEAERTLFHYEFMLMDQPTVLEVPAMESLLEFSYEAFFAERGMGWDRLASSTYFVSGSCVREPPVRTDPPEEDSLPDTTEETPTTTTTSSSSTTEEDEPETASSSKVDPDSTEVTNEEGAPSSEATSSSSNQEDSSEDSVKPLPISETLEDSEAAAAASSSSTASNDSIEKPSSSAADQTTTTTSDVSNDSVEPSTDVSSQDDSTESSGSGRTISIAWVGMMTTVITTTIHTFYYS